MIYVYTFIIKRLLEEGTNSEFRNFSGDTKNYISMYIFLKNENLIIILYLLLLNESI